MKLYYYHCRTGNFGDDLNPWLWSRLIPDLLDDDASMLFVGIGTLLNQNIPPEPNKVVFGTGVGYGALPVLDERWDFRCVRGPLTAKLLNINPSLAITDAAALLATVDLPAVARDGGRAFIPHHQSAFNADWEAICRHVGIRYIDPGADVETVMHEIRRSTEIVTEAMHGAIFADTFRIPWKAVSCYGHILEFKWQDWCASLGMSYRPERLPEVWDADRCLPPYSRLKNTVKRCLSTLGIRNPGWVPVMPAKSSPREFRAVTDRLSQLLANGNFALSDQSRFESAIERLDAALRKMKEAYAK